MSTKHVKSDANPYVSPYLPRPRGSYARVIGDTGVEPNRVDDGGAASGIQKWDPRREDEARRQLRLHLP